MTETKLPAAQKPPKKVAPLTILLGVVFVLFCGILVFVFVVTKRVNPVMLDQQGHPIQSQSQPAGSSGR